MPLRGPTGVPAHVVGDLHQRAGQHAQFPADLHQRVVGAEGSEQILRLPELQPGLGRDLLRGQPPEVGVRVEPGADGGAADGEVPSARVGVPDPIEGEVQLRHPAAEDLAQAHGGGVLQVGAAHHDDVVVLLGLGRQLIAEPGDGRVEPLIQLGHHRDVHGGGEGVVGGLAAVDVVVGVHGRLRAAHSPGELDGPVGDDLVGVHVGLGAGAGLEHHQREVVVEAPRDHVVGRAGDEFGLVRGQLTQLGVGLGRGLLQHAEGADHGTSPDEGVAADVEVVEAALRLRAPVAVVGDLDLAHGVGFNAGAHEPNLPAPSGDVRRKKSLTAALGGAAAVRRSLVTPSRCPRNSTPFPATCAHWEYWVFRPLTVP